MNIKYRSSELTEVVVTLDEFDIKTAVMELLERNNHIGPHISHRKSEVDIELFETEDDDGKFRHRCEVTIHIKQLRHEIDEDEQHGKEK